MDENKSETVENTGLMPPFGNIPEKASTPTLSLDATHPLTDTTASLPKIESPYTTDSTGVVIKSEPPKRKRGRPRKSEILNAEAIKLESELEYFPGQGSQPPVNLEDGKAALQSQLKYEFGRVVRRKGKDAHGNPLRGTETKFARVIRKMVSLAMAGDTDMIKLSLEKLGGRTPIAPKEEQASTFVIENHIPSPEEKPNA